MRAEDYNESQSGRLWSLEDLPEDLGRAARDYGVNSVQFVTAVREAQAVRGLRADGKLGPRTWSAINERGGELAVEKTGLDDRSRERLSTCDERLQRVVEAAAGRIPLRVLCGHRGRAAQNRAFREGKSKVRFPGSRHNKMPSLAVDIAPLPIDWEDLEAFKRLGAEMKRTAAEMGIDITWGGDWGWDFPHYQVEGGV